MGLAAVSGPKVIFIILIIILIVIFIIQIIILNLLDLNLKESSCNRPKNHGCRLGLSISGSVRFLHKKINQTDIINFKILKPKPVRTDRFWFGSVFVVQKPVKPKANLSARCTQTTSKSRCPVPTNYKQISVPVVQENRSTHKLQANYNIIIKKKQPTRCRDKLEMELES